MLSVDDIELSDLIEYHNFYIYFPNVICHTKLKSIDSDRRSHDDEMEDGKNLFAIDPSSSTTLHNLSSALELSLSF